MELMSMVGIEEYRLLLFQPDPETGERICVGVAVDGELIFDKDLSRVQCFSNRTGPEILRLYLRDIAERIVRSKGEDLERMIRDFAPMFVLSAPRKIVSPVSPAVKRMLLRRFVGAGTRVHSERMRLRREFFERLKKFALKVPMNPKNQIIENARPIDILGLRPQGLGRVNRVALAIKRENNILLMDGLDLNLLKSQDLFRACTQVVHTFWQYGRAPKLYGEKLNRVAVIFNGSQHLSSQSREAHEFALAQFRKESDETIEASSPIDTRRLEDILAG